MPAARVAVHTAQTSGNNTFNATLVGTGSNRLIVVIGLATAGGAQTLNSLTLNGQSGQNVASSKPTNESQQGNISVYVFTDSQHPGAGTFTFTPTWSAAASTAYLVYELSDAAQASPFITGFTSPAATPNVAIATISVTLSGASGLLGVFVGCLATNDSTAAPTTSNASASLSNYVSTLSGTSAAWLGGYDDAVVASTSEVYSVDVDLNKTAAASDNIFPIAFAVNDFAEVPMSADSITAGTLRAGDTATIQLSNATNASGKTLELLGTAVTATAQDINSISFTVPDLKTFGPKTGDYNTNLTMTVTDGLESDTIDFQIAPDVGDEVGAITALEGIYAEPEFAGVAVTDLYYTATISGADFTVGAVPVLETEQTFQLWIQDQTDGVWGTPFTVIIPASGGVIVVPSASRGDMGSIAQYLRSTGSFSSQQTNDIIFGWLISEGVASGQLNDMLYSYLANLGYKGSLSDKLYGWKNSA